MALIIVVPAKAGLGCLGAPVGTSRLAVRGRRMMVAAALAAVVAVPARGDEIGSAFRLFDTVRLGAFAHNIGMREDGEVDVSVHVVTSRLGATSAAPTDFADFLLKPRLHAGVMANTAGDTSYAYAGLTWRADLFAGFFSEFEFGGAYNNYAEAPDRIDMGCHVTFRESAGLGYRFGEHIDLIASIEHASHAHLCGETNPGITNVGMRLGYRF